MNTSSLPGKYVSLLRFWTAWQNDTVVQTSWRFTAGRKNEIDLHFTPTSLRQQEQATFGSKST